MTVEDQIARSSQTFCHEVWPVIREAVGGRGDPWPIEQYMNHDFAALLDREAGIDILYMLEDGGLQGIASRVQVTDEPFDTFTIRHRLPSGNPTELEKRLRYCAPTVTALGPHWTVQAYVGRSHRQLIAVAGVKTYDLIALVASNMIYGRWQWPTNRRGPVWEQVNGQDGNGFLVVPWSALESSDGFFRYP